MKGSPMTLTDITTTTLTNPIQIQVYESNDDTDMGEMVEFHSFKALAEWCEYEVEQYVHSRATVRLALDKFTVDIISGRYKFRTFQIETLPYPGYEGPRVWTRYILQSVPVRKYDEDGHCTVCTGGDEDSYPCYCWV